MKPNRSSFDQAYIRWRERFAPFEARCFEALCEFVRVHFDELLDRYYWEGHESSQDFPAWAFERYLRDLESEGDQVVTVVDLYTAPGGSWKRKDEEWRTPK